MQEIREIRELFAIYKDDNSSVEKAEELFFAIKPKLEKVKNELGEANSTYINICSEALGHIQEIIWGTVNYHKPYLYHTESYSDSSHIIKSGAILNIKMRDYATKDPKFDKFWDRTQKIVDMHLDTGSIPLEHGWVPTMDSQGFPQYVALEGSKKKSEGCYIATMAYGNYDHSQVIKLRKFRDISLSKNVLGRHFIKVYYNYSPLLVEKLKDKDRVNCIIRILLNHFIKLTRIQ